jgi:hypothetical protein
MQRGVKRTLRDLHLIARDLLQSLCNCVTVNGTQRDNLEDQQVQSALREIKPLIHRHTSTFCISETLSKKETSLLVGVSR